LALSVLCEQSSSSSIESLQQTQDLYTASIVGCVAPPCSPLGLPPPQINYQFTQPVVPIQPNPLTLEAVKKAESALATAQQDSDSETRLDGKIDKV
jgi:hypothetical protein